MPAIKPARLKQQASDLAIHFSQPALFVRQLHALLDHYSDHTHRKGKSGEPSPLVSSYNTPAPVLRQVWLEIASQIKEHPEQVLPVCDALWAEPNIELQLMAARLLGSLPLDPPDQVTDRLQAWVQQGLERRTLDDLLDLSLARIKEESPGAMLNLMSTWLESSDQSLKLAGLRTMLSMINHSGTENLPSIFRLLTPYIRLAPSRLRPDILAVVSALAHCSPAETAYLLQQNLSVPDNPDTPWVIRQVLHEFPPDISDGLRQALKR